MRNIFLLLKVQMLSFFGINQALHTPDKKEKRRAGFLSGVFVVAVATIMGGVYAYCLIYAKAFGSMNALSLLPTFLMVLASICTLFFTIYQVHGTLFCFRDYDMVMALPVKTGQVVASRVLLLYLINLGFSLVVLLPGGAAYAVEAHPGAWFYMAGLLTLFFVPLVPIVASAVFGTLVAFIASRFRFKNLMITVLTFAVLALLTVYAVQGQQAPQSAGGIPDMLLSSLNRLYPLTGLYRQGVTGGSMWALLLFLGVSLLVFLLFCFLLGLFFRSLNSRLASGRTRRNYRLGALKTGSPMSALFRKELRRYFASPLYVMNTGFGAVMLVGLSVALLFLPADKLGAMMNIPGLGEIVGRAAPLAVALLAATICTTDCSISLEGRNLWILRSLPVSAMTVYKSKLAVNLVISLPTVLVCGVLLCVSLRPEPLFGLFYFLVPGVYALFSALLGLLANLKLPNFTWTSETVVIKQSAAAFVGIFAPVIAAGIPLALAFTVPQIPVLALLAATTVVVALACIVLYHILRTKGEAMLRKL